MRAVSWLTFVVLCFSFALDVTACHEGDAMIVRFDTDAIVPDESKGDSLWEPAPLFDRLRIEVFPPGSTLPCGVGEAGAVSPAACVNDFAVSTSGFLNKQISIGIPKLASAGYRIRARLYVSRFAVGGEPNPDSTIDVAAALPADTYDDGFLFFATANVGRPADVTAPPALPPETNADSVVGTWPGAQRVPCSSAPPPGTACVPGGAFWMGSQDGADVPGLVGSWHRLAVMSPFFLDQTEVLVAAMRSRNPTVAAQVSPWTGTSSYCTYTKSPGPFDTIGVTCVSPVVASTYCQSLGGDLPTGAQFEYAASALGRSPFPWGDEPPSCEGAVWGRLSSLVQNGSQSWEYKEPCASIASSPIIAADQLNPSVSTSGAEAPCLSPCTNAAFRDALVLQPPGGPAEPPLVDLAGNYREWTLDGALDLSDPYWADHVLPDPYVALGNGKQQVRGGGWDSTEGTLLRADISYASSVTSSLTNTSFRCAYAGR